MKNMEGSDPKSYSVNPTRYEKSTFVFRTNTDLDWPSKFQRINPRVQRDSKQEKRD